MNNFSAPAAHGCPAKKGSVFTIEALFASLLFIMFIASVMAFAEQFKGDSWTIADGRMADDAMALLQKNGTLGTLNITLIENDLKTILGNGTQYRFEMTTYNYTNGAFLGASNSSFGQALPDDKEITVADRGFTASANGSISNYTMARLYTWR